MNIVFILNNNEVKIELDPTTPLLRVLREQLGIMSIKEGCGRGECGTCTILLDGNPVTSCMVPVGQVQGKNIKTLEGLDTEDIMIDIQKGFMEQGAVQCGFCTPGFLISIYALIKKIPLPTRDEVRLAISGNICRCTGYTKIIDAAIQAAERISMK